MKKKLAFFDIDGTIFRWSLFIEYVDLLIDKGIFPKTLKAEVQPKYEAWLDRESSYEEYLSLLIDIFDENIKGVHIDTFRKVVEEALKNKKKRVYIYTRNLIQKLKKEGYYIVAISRSAKIAIDIFAADYGFDKTYGVMFEVDKNGYFTGEILNKDLIFDKGKIVQRVLDKTGFDLEDSYAIGDTESDAAMLKLVQNPIAFNPNKKLYNIALENNWNIVVERKDVIYKIN